MKIIKLTLILLLIASITKAQGVQFITGQTWEQVKAKAKAENKFIFMDVYATWCGPCKLMDNEVYPKSNVGDFMNENFINVKLQYDTSKQDNEEVQKWYADAHSICEEYDVTAFPTYLFFSPDGRVVHRFSGAIDDTSLIHVASNALNPEKQYYTLLEGYLQGQKNYAKLPYMARTAREAGDKKMAKAIAIDYIQNYLNKADNEVLFEKKNIDFISEFSGQLSSADKYFKLFYNQANKMDAITRKDFSQNMVDFIITKEEIDPYIKVGIQGGPEPAWNTISSTIKKKYNKAYEERTVIAAKIRWYDYKKDGPNLVKYSILQEDKYGVDTSFAGRWNLNNLCFSVIFQYSNDKKDLNKAIKWMEMINSKDPNDATSLDTYANLLYKIGRKQEAITQETKAVNLNETAAAKLNMKPDPIYRETVRRMKNGEPTWGQTYNQ